MWDDDLWKNEMYDERSPMPGLEPEIPARLE